jgi:hypothetical protein
MASGRFQKYCTSYWQDCDFSFELPVNMNCKGDTEAVLLAMLSGGRVAPCRDVCWLPLPLSRAVCTARVNPISRYLHTCTLAQGRLQGPSPSL